ncbi:CRISPR-associated protein Csh1 [Anaerobacterium chartisolvens]|uniref:CRISPR-associated protein Csh1 n=1 Tax=Anaerobacterium chartisolvens TaxID=1297424 RepID=A0A369AWW7_9FIRM|nr:hypothetical protein [Anaerobacterium chartisolvens]RCX12707.1 CRISPR-associated protein Csh1 [Anaerobacterium chartisolvens]
MVNDFAALFEKAYDAHGDKMILDSYVPDNGLYIRINPDGSMEGKAINRKAFEDIRDHELVKWFKSADYYSRLIDMNKPIDPKKTIHSNNYLSVFIKKDIFPGVGKGDKLLSEDELEASLERYFQVFKKPNGERYDAKALELIEASGIPETEGGEVDRCKDFILGNLDSISELIRSHEFDKYIKIFFHAAMETYILECKRYLIPKIFNDNKYNIKINDMLVGLSNNNIGFNSKKPYLNHKSTNYDVSFRISIKDAILVKKFFDWLECQESDVLRIPYDYDFAGVLGEEYREKAFYYIHFTRGTTLTVEEFDYVPEYTGKMEFTLYNYLDIHYKEKDSDRRLPVEDKYISSLRELEDEVSRTFFNGRLKYSYYKEPKDIKIKTGEFSKTMMDVLLISRNAAKDYFKKGIKDAFYEAMYKMSLLLVKEQARMSDDIYFDRAARALNLRFSLLEYFNGRDSDMGGRVRLMLDAMQNKLEDNNAYDCENDSEFYFFAGQAAYYLLKQSEAKDKKMGMIEPFLRVNSPEQLKAQIKNAFITYNHAIYLEGKRFKKVFSMIQGYTAGGDMRSNDDMFLAGFMAENVLLKKDE